MTAPKHEFLYNSSNGLSNGAKAVVTIREFIESLPETRSTFKLKELDFGGFPSSQAREVHFEFAGSWTVPDRISDGRRKMYVNPNGIHAEHFADVIVGCPCGETMVHNYSTDVSPDTGGSDGHGEDCMPYHRLRARADLGELRHRELLRLTAIGWRSVDVARRFGVSRNLVGSIIRDMDESMATLRDRYRRMAGATYAYLVRDNNVDAKAVGEVYDHAVSTLGRWANEYLDYESESDRVFARHDEGGFRWQRPPSKKPDWVNDRVVADD